MLSISSGIVGEKVARNYAFYFMRKVIRDGNQLDMNGKRSQHAC